MDNETRELITKILAKLDAERIEIDSSLIAHRTLLDEVLARQFAGQPEEFAGLIDECMAAARDLPARPGRSEAERQELAAQIAAKLAMFGQRVGGTL